MGISISMRPQVNPLRNPELHSLPSIPYHTRIGDPPPRRAHRPGWTKGILQPARVPLSRRCHYCDEDFSAVQENGGRGQHSVWAEAIDQLSRYLGATHGWPPADRSAVYGIACIGLTMRVYKYDDINQAVPLRRQCELPCRAPGRASCNAD
jgi:hypothetical protein